MSNQYILDDDANLDFVFDWSNWLATGETISTYTVTVPTGITLGTGTKAPSETDGKVTYWVSGGTIGKRYKVACKITTSASRIDERTMMITVLER
jgi:hypothetical protein